ncbi:hypothetical protein ACF0H5_018341 [Mactra antiquata]
MAAQMSTSSSASDVDVPRQHDDAPFPRGRRRRRRQPLAALVRENQVRYKRFMKRKLSKRLGELGISATSECDSG